MTFAFPLMWSVGMRTFHVEMRPHLFISVQLELGSRTLSLVLSSVPGVCHVDSEPDNVRKTVLFTLKLHTLLETGNGFSRYRYTCHQAVQTFRDCEHARGLESSQATRARGQVRRKKSSLKDRAILSEFETSESRNSPAGAE